MAPFKVISTVSSGKFGTVLKVKVGSDTFAAKKLVKASTTHKTILEELELLKYVSKVQGIKDHVLVPVGLMEDKNHWYLITELLEDYITLTEWKSDLQHSHHVKVFNQILATVELLHKNGVAHRDIKPENIMVRRRDLHVKLIDFGFSCVQSQCELWFGGTLVFQHPKLVQRWSLNESGWNSHTTGLRLVDFQTSDLWAVGMVGLTMVNNGVHPLEPYYAGVPELQAFYFSPLTQALAQQLVNKWNKDVKAYFNTKKQLLQCNLSIL